MRPNCLANVFTAVLIVGLLAGCSKQPPYPPDVVESLAAAEDNRAELETVITHYLGEGDSLKLAAAYYLIGNMEGHCYATYSLKDTAGNEIDFDVLDYPDFNALLAAADTLEDRHGEIDFERTDKLYDLKTISADFLITHIDFAFRAWREKPWARNLSFDDFRDYVLPYRGSNEPLEQWRETFWQRYAAIDTLMVDSADPVEAAAIINDDIKSWFTFDPRYYYHPTDQGLSEMMATGMGRCEDMTNLTIFAMRANGLAVTSDYTPHWADAGNNHAWNAIVIPDGTVIPFMGAECNPGSYRLANKMAKVYRKSFAKQNHNLIFQDRKQEKVPGWLAGRSYLDVTADYQDVCDVTVTLAEAVPDSVDIAYLCVFNSGEWKAIHWGWIENGTATFTDMGKEIAYLPALYVNEKIVPCGIPFILDADCARRELPPDTAHPTSVGLVSTTGRHQVTSTDGVAESFLTVGLEYELFYMGNDDWVSLGAVTATGGPAVFDGVPAGALYWLVAEDSDREERIFTFEHGRQVWW